MTGNPSRDLVHETTQPPVAKTKLYRGLTKDQIEALGPLTFGFDIGIASVGWAVVAPKAQCIVALGSHVFKAAEDKEGHTHNEARRSARVARIRYATRKWRLSLLRRVFADMGILPLAAKDANGRWVDPMIAKRQEKGSSDVTSPWALRSRALTEGSALPIDDFARALYFVVANRGYSFESDGKSNTPLDTSSAEAKDQEKYASALADSHTFYSLHKERYHTLGNLIFQASSNGAAFENNPFGLGKKNRPGEYRFLAKREWLVDEVRTLFAARSSSNSMDANPVLPVARQDMARSLRQTANPPDDPTAPVRLCDFIVSLIQAQKPPILTENLDQTIGECELERGELRAAKNCFSNERRTWLEKLNHLRIKRNGKEVELASDEHKTIIKAIVDLPYASEYEKLTLKDIRKVLVEKTGFPADYRDASFNAASYRLVPTDTSARVYIRAQGAAAQTLSDAAKSTSTKTQRADYSRCVQSGSATFAQVRATLGLLESHRFEVVDKESRMVPVDEELTTTLRIEGEQGAFKFLGIEHLALQFEGKPLSKKDREKYWARFFAAARAGTVVTLADIRKTMIGSDAKSKAWVFVLNKRTVEMIELDREASTPFPIEYKDPQAAEEAVLMNMKGWHALRKAMETRAPKDWDRLCDAHRIPFDCAVNATTRESAIRSLDMIAETLTRYQLERDIRHQLSKSILSQEAIDAIAGVKFSGYRNLSLKAIGKILLSLEVGDSYTKAVENAYGKIVPDKAPKRYLDPLERFEFKRHRYNLASAKSYDTGHRDKKYKELANPVVARSFNRARAVLNAMVATFGSPEYVNVETSRDLARSKKRRNEIEDTQLANRSKNERADSIAREIIASKSKDGTRVPRPELVLKVRLYLEQACKCMYTGADLDLPSIIADPRYCEIDHIWPKSITMDESRDNKVLVLAGANQNKLDSIPYDWFNSGTGSNRSWDDFKRAVLGVVGLNPQKKERLLATSIDASEFRARNLVDTGYVTRLFAKMLREGLLFMDAGTGEHVSDAIHKEVTRDSPAADRLEHFERARVRMPQGSLTSILRRGWMISKDRDAGDLHHALDACIIAVTTPSLIHKVNNFHRFKETCEVDNGLVYRKQITSAGTKTQVVDAQRFFPTPWGTVRGGEFRAELLARLAHDAHSFTTPANEERRADYQSYPDFLRETVSPVIVTHLIAKRTNGGELHSMNPVAMRHHSVRLSRLTNELLDVKRYGKLFVDQWNDLFLQLSAKLTERGGNAADAFPDDRLELRDGSVVERVRLPIPCLTSDELVTLGIVKTNAQASKSTATFQRFALTALSTKEIDEWLALTKESDAQNVPYLDLPIYQFARRNKPLLIAIREPIERFEQLEKIPRASRTDTDKSELKAVQRLLAVGIPKPETTDPHASARRQAQRPDYKPPLVRSIRVPAKGGNGVIVRGGLVGLGDATCVDVLKVENRFVFIPRYAMAGAALARENLVIEQTKGLQIARLFGGMRVRIQHHGLANAFRIVSKGKSEQDEEFIEVEPMFSDHIFEGTFAYYEPSNERPVLELHDRAPFAWPNDGFSPPRVRTKLFAVKGERNRSNAVSDPKTKWFSRESLNAGLEREYFTIRQDFKIKVDQAKSIEIVPLDILGSS
jgi:CRISPR subtype II RNA-guided endonuclease Cas9/Csn1